MLSQSAVNEIDIVFFAHLPLPQSTNAQAALLPSLIVLWLFGGSLSGIAVGTQAFTARRFAENRDGDAGAVLFNALVFSLVAGLCFTGIGYLAMGSILKLLIKVPEVRQEAEHYIHYRLLGVTSMAATFAFKAFFDGIGKTHVHLVSAVVMNIINVLLCLICIFGNTTLGVAPMGMAGAGLAALASTWVGLLIMVGYALHPAYRKRFAPFQLRHYDSALLWPILRLSIPGGIATIAIMTGFGLFAAIASKLDEMQPAGTEPLNSASMTVIVGVLKLTFTACLAFGTATATLVSQSLGEKDSAKATRFGWASVKLALIIFGVIGFAQAVGAEPLLAFVTKSELVREAALTPMRIMGVVTPIIAVAMILTQALFGAGDSKFVMIVELVLHFLVLVPLAYFLGVVMGVGLLGLWLAAVTYILLLGIAMVWKFHGGAWKQITL
jgi:multidrug resistance protein, MATE family